MKQVIDSNDIKTFTRANLEAWEEVAPIHKKLNHDHLLARFRQPGFSCLDDVETEILKMLDVAGKDVAQICCNNGQELLSIKNLGARRCVGFDGAKSFLDQGRELADAAGVDVEFIESDIYEIDNRFHQSFDLLVITIGVLSWMPDIGRFFSVLGPLLRTGGSLFIYEQHPILNMIKPGAAKDPIEWELSYFDKEPYVEEHGLDYFSGETYAAKPVTSFTHTLSDVMQAGLETGLSIRWFEELPHHISNTWWNVEHSDLGLPMCFTLVFDKA